MKSGPVIMIMRTKDSLWNIAKKNHQHQRNSKPKHRLENSCWLHSGTLMVWCSLADQKKVLQWTQKGYNETLKNLKKHITRKEAEIYCIFLLQDNVRPQTGAPTTDAIESLGFTGYHIQPTAWISLLAISTCSPNWRKTSGDKASVLLKKSLLQYASGFGRKKKTFWRMEFKNLLNNGRSVLKLEEIMWKTDYAQL